jgi:glycerol-3-phosphate acyltransferase PlsX
VLLKATEGLAKLSTRCSKTEFTRNFLTRAAAMLAYPVLIAFRQRIDPRRYNGATLVGLKGVVVKSHGSADALAVQVRAAQGIRRGRARDSRQDRAADGDDAAHRDPPLTDASPAASTSDA